MKRSLLILLCTITSQLFAQNNNPVIPKSGSTLNSFIPKGWKIILQSSKGDLNKDGIADQAIVIENTDTANFLKNEGFGAKKLNLNPRILLVLFKSNSGGYHLAAKNKNFIPSENDEETTCLSDPLLGEGGITIEKGLLKIQYQYFLSCGSWYVTNTDYTFRFQNQKFEWIGYDEYSLHRSSGQQSITSINFSTKRRSETTGGNEFNDKDNKPKTIWKKVNISKLLNLETLTKEVIDQIL
ncbi:hypothetical protein [Pedobacter metabolipauper]|uniref:Uncharacterized protein n=1 Tax=Pedobacter metabolipauper TaxID=425513 RepID=A0A4R6SVZ6_9SPHI|nr:hypothetical protein [Pedobacter metabolipauper]TDQ08292.1 hypothetical protein ATK78_2801 [Pedobacter metabolipauper]